MSVETVLSSNAPGQGYSKRRVAIIVGVLSLAAFMSSLDLFIVNLAFPYISRDFHGSSLDSLSWVLNGYSILFAAVLVPAGRWADRIGRRRMFAAGLVVFTLGSVLSGVAPDVALSDRCPSHPGRRRRHDGPGVPVTATRGRSGSRSRPGHRHVVGDRRTRCRPWTGHRRIPRRRVVALGLLDQHPRRRRDGLSRLQGVAGEPRRVRGRTSGHARCGAGRDRGGFIGPRTGEGAVVGLDVD